MHIKNIIVVDGNGNEYEATYLKRARGLVKNGRACFIDENKICLLCPPNNETEDNKISENKNIQSKVSNSNFLQPAYQNDTVSLRCILEQLEKIHSQTDYIFNAIEAMKMMSAAVLAWEPEIPLKGVRKQTDS